MTTMDKPSRKGPFIALGASLYGVGGLIVNIFTGTHGEVMLALESLPVGLACIGLSVWWLDRRATALERWKDDRLLAWALKDDPTEE